MDDMTLELIRAMFRKEKAILKYLGRDDDLDKVEAAEMEFEAWVT